jgi:hypothetical protein
MDQFQPRPSIPYEWGEKARCPACSAPDLEVQRQSSGPDQLRCTACGLRFELELGGPHLRVMRWPDLRAQDALPAAGSWMTAGELRGALQAQFPAVGGTRLQAPAEPQPAAKAAERPAPVQGSGEPAPAAPTIDDLTARVKKLVDLGSTPMEVRASLAQSGAAPEQVERALRAAGQMVQREQKQQGRKLWGRLAAAAVLVAGIVWGGLLLAGSLAAQRDEFAASLRSTLMPGVAQAAGLTTPVVQRLQSPPGASDGTPVPCPTSPAAAAELFGGQAETWSPGPNGWIRIDASGEEVTIRVPYGMLAMYFRVGEQLVPVEVPGPAAISQAPALAISCP